MDGQANSEEIVDTPLDLTGDNDPQNIAPVVEQDEIEGNVENGGGGR